MGPPKSRKIALMGAVSVDVDGFISIIDSFFRQVFFGIQFVQGQFVDSYEPTIENTFTKTVKITRSGYEICLYSIFPLEYSTGIDGYVLVYSIDSPKSLEVCQIIQEKLIEITGNPK
ncbi:GTP-binding protein Rheb [Caligus rogercresseyi]|uniref:GTP-binding protein Rheb n=1 Tax=Caligus rogercresseyi TaxID=217165 RepID=A0A7T8HLZ9_CALRO|nr:GTP-binding protein Rheb [Caligus rogercresseyi]